MIPDLTMSGPYFNADGSPNAAGLQLLRVINAVKARTGGMVSEGVSEAEATATGGATQTLAEWFADVEAATSGLAAHLSDTSDAHDASAISYAGGTGMSATDVEAAIDELATEKANAAVTLTAGLGISGGGDLSGNRSLAFDPSELTDVAIVSGDGLVFMDVSDSNNPKRRLVSSLVSDLGIWTAGNDGAGSGLDADLLDGKNIGTSGNAIPLLDGANIWSGTSNVFPNTGLRVLDTNASHTLTYKPGSNITADRTFTITTGDADRTLDISGGNVTITAAAATVLDDTTTGAMCTTLGLGTGDAPTWAGGTFTSASAFQPQVLIQNTNDDANSCYMIMRKTPASDYVRNGDTLGTILFSGKATGGGAVNSSYLTSSAKTDAGASAIDSIFVFAASTGGAIGERLYISGGLYHPSATGGDKGNNTINFGAVYDDNVLLCAPLNDDMTQEDWDALVPNRPIPAKYTIEEYETGRIIPAKTEKRVRLDAKKKPVEYDHELEPARPETALRKVMVSKERVEETTHRTARRHFEMIAGGFNPKDPRAYVDRMRKDKALPGLPTIAEWKARMIENGVLDKMSAAERDERLVLAVDYLAVAFAAALDRIEALEAKAQ